MSSLAGRIALVTGAGGGIGRATALELARRGADVAVHYHRNREGAEETARTVGKTARSLTFAADLTRAAEARALVVDVEKRLGPVDILVNNAGDLVARRPLLEITEDYWREVLDTNLASLVFCTQAAAASMISRKRGVVVTVSSLAAHNGGGPGALAYAAAKGGVISLTKALAKELAPHGIRVNCVSPGLIETEFHGRFTPRDSFDAAARTIPLGRAGQPEDVAQAIAFLCSDDSSFLAGETIEVNGGMFMR